MLIDMKERLEEAEVKDLVEYAIFPDPDALEDVVQEYKTNPKHELYAFEDEGELLGIIGVTTEQEIMRIRHLAVAPAYRGLGYGRGLVLELIAMKNPQQLEAVTDDESVDFYRNIGFTVTSLGEKYPGTERFKCVYQVDGEDELE